MDTLDRARWWVASGYSVIPIGYKSKRPAFDALRLTGQDHGSGWGEYKRRAPTDDELFQWFGGPRRNLGIVTGYEGLVVIDFDSMASYETWCQWAEQSGASWAPQTYTVASRRGMHVYLEVGDDVTSFSVGAIDVKAQWGYVLAAGSVHPSGHVYTCYCGSVTYPTGCLADAFPLVPEPRQPQPRLPRVTDPFESASRVTDSCGMSIADVKARTTLQEVLGVSLDTQWAVCPIHADTEPSMRLYADGHYHCYGCAAHGDVVDLYAAMHKLTVREALAEMASKL